MGTLDGWQWGQEIRGQGDFGNNAQIQALLALNGQKAGDWKQDPATGQYYIDTPYGRITDDGNRNHYNFQAGGNDGMGAYQFNGGSTGAKYSNEHGSNMFRMDVDKNGYYTNGREDTQSEATRNMALAGIFGLPAAGLAMGGGIGGVAGITAGTGATPGTAGAILSAAGNGVGMAGAGGAGLGAVAPAGNAAADELFAAERAGATPGVVSRDLANAGLIDRLTGSGLSLDKAKGLAGLLGSAYLNNKSQQQQNEAVQRANETVLAAGNKAADLSKFTPYNVTGGLAGARFENGTAIQELNPAVRNIMNQGLAGAQMFNQKAMAPTDPKVLALQQQSLDKSKGFMDMVSTESADRQAKMAYENYNKWAKPAQGQQFAGLQNTLAGQGMLGLKVNGGSVNGGQAGGGINPYYADFAEGVARADLKNYENSVRLGQDINTNNFNLGTGFLNNYQGSVKATQNEQMNNQAMGANYLQSAQSIDKMGMDAIAQGGKLGESASLAGARAGGFLTSAANSAAGNLQQRQQWEANQDNARNNQIWEAIWKNVL